MDLIKKATTIVSFKPLQRLNFRPTNGQRDEQEPENKTNDSEVDLESVLTVSTEADWRDLIPGTFQGHRSQGVQLNVR
ncbi:unnamed protein product [Cyprideis torosa]|uniref:Uncharacterized protein n=1 Tax=Cyprideis torosa TaxID=163714 RepID=A0A7R8WM85_9CRUS|nr:unnamed protein product [Cyprideis torosa]CAG0899017.1 unnamed protein product [Cyprideis torosa]